MGVRNFFVALVLREKVFEFYLGDFCIMMRNFEFFVKKSFKKFLTLSLL